MILTTKKGGGYPSNNLGNPSGSSRDNIPYLRDKKSLKESKVKRLKELQRKEITELDKFCDNCKEHLNENVKIVKYDGPYSDKYSSYCPVCCRVDLTDEYLYSKEYQEFMKKLEKNVYNGIVPSMFNAKLNARFDVMKILGSVKCKRCGCDDVRALQLDHINGDGVKDRKRFKHVEYMWNYYIFNPKEAKKKLQVLCGNCNWIKRIENKEDTKILTKDGKLKWQKKIDEYKQDLQDYMKKNDKEGYDKFGFNKLLSFFQKILFRLSIFMDS